MHFNKFRKETGKILPTYPLEQKKKKNNLATVENPQKGSNV